MSKAKALLNSLSGSAYNVTASNYGEEYIVIDDERFIYVPDSLKRLGVQYDHNIETVTFDCPRYWDDQDISEMKIYVNYIRADGVKGRYCATNIHPSTNRMTFDWTISGHVTQVKGAITFLVCIVRVDEEGYEERHWNSELCQQCHISEGLECDEDIVTAYPDIITHILLRMEEIGEGGGGGGVNEEELKEAIDSALQEAKESGEFDGPPGPQGPKGDTGATGPQGPQGIPGVAGASGVHVGTDTPPETATVWVNPTGEPTGTEDWEFDMTDGSTDTKTVVVLNADEADANGQLGILKLKQSDGTWKDIPAIIGPQGPKGDTGLTGATGSIGPQGPKGDTGATGPQGEQGPAGAAFTYDMFTSEQLASLKGPKGDTGSVGPQGPKGDTGDTGPQGPKGDTGATGPQGPEGESAVSAIYVGSDVPPETASVWIDPNGGHTSSSEEWTFMLEDGTTETKTVVILG